jgi:hypothetical protein
MSLVNKGELGNLEVRFHGLQAKIRQRTEQQNLGMSEGVAGGRDRQFLDSLRVELRNIASQIVGMKYDPLQVIECMSSGPRIETRIETRVETHVTDVTRDRLVAFLDTNTDKFINREKLKELIA